MAQKFLGLMFISGVVILSYIASIQLVTDRVMTKITVAQAERRIRPQTYLSGGPVPLKPILTERTSYIAVKPKKKRKGEGHQIARPEPVRKHSLGDRRPASLKKKKHKNKHK